MNELTPLQNAVMAIGGVLVVFGAAIYIFWPMAAFVLFAIGAVSFGCMQMLQRYDGRNFVIRRLRRQQLLGAMALLVAACLMAMQTFRFGFALRNEWVVALTVACVLELYTAFRLPTELEKEPKKRK